MDSLPSGQSITVTYWSELLGVEINLDFAKDTVEVCTDPCTDWKRMGF